MGAPSTNFKKNVIFTFINVAKIGKNWPKMEFFDIFWKFSFFECCRSKNVSGMFHDLKNVKIA
jgi:hypothetical protein